MVPRQDEGEWTEVSYRRGRLRQRHQTRPPFHPPEQRFQHGTRPSYASATRTGRKWGGDYPQRRYSRPQFFDYRGHYVPPQVQFKNLNSRQRYRADTWRAKHTTHTAPHTDRNSRQRYGADTWRAKHTTHTAPHTDRNRREERNESGDPDFGVKIRTMHKIIKVAHHLKNATAAQPPPTIRKLTATLSTMIKPAIPSEKTRILIEGNAKNWEYTNMLILRDHYTETLECEIDSLPHMTTHNWQEPFKVASTWAKRNLGRRLERETLEQVEALIVAKVKEDEEETHEPPPHSPPSDGLTPPPLVPTETIAAQIDLPMNRAVSAGVEEPRQGGVRMVTVATITDVVGDSDLTNESLVDMPVPPPGYLPTPLAPSPINSPLPQRDTRERRTLSTLNPNVLRENDPLMQLSVQEVMDLTDNEPNEVPPTQRLTTAIQSRLRLRPRTIIRTPSKTPTARRPTKHIKTLRKKHDWSLTVNKKWLIIGDSNLARFPPFTCEDLQIDSFPGATFSHAKAIINKTTTSTLVEKVILSFGINNRTQKDKKGVSRELLTAIRTAEHKFPDASIWVPLINFSERLPVEQKQMLKYLNQKIDTNCMSIPLLQEENFSTRVDHIHWTTITADEMLKHWRNHANF